VAPSPKSKVRESPLWVSAGENVKLTCWPTLGVGSLGTMVRVTSSVTEDVCALDEPATPDPPKFHDHEVGSPVEASWN
jgi:hypothetical protein